MRGAVRKFWQRFKVWRKTQEDRLPFIRRRRYDRAVFALNRRKKIVERLKEEKTALARFLLVASDAPASKATIAQSIPIDSRQADELCLFVTHAPTPTLKHHVVDHVNSLIDENIAVILIVNTDHHAAEFKLQPDFASRLTGLLVRQNVGFDFAAWGHALCLLPRDMPKRRLYFVNDSIVGPLDQTAYRTMLERIRRSGADMIGLTQNTKPKPHLQSFFLVFNERMIRSPLFASVMTNLFSLPTKSAVIDVYETHVTSYFQEHGFQCEALFPNMVQDDGFTDDTLARWSRLIQSGFPFIKGTVLRNAAESEDLIRLVPSKYR